MAAGLRVIKMTVNGIPFRLRECTFQSINHEPTDTIICSSCGWRGGGFMIYLLICFLQWPGHTLSYSRRKSLTCLCFTFSFLFPHNPSSASPAGTARFSQEPADQSVVRGQRVILSCVVFNYSGIVQWTKDGLALGIGEDLQGETPYTLFGPPPVCPATCDYHAVSQLTLIHCDWNCSQATTTTKKHSLC